MFSDLRFAFRQLRKSPGFTAVAVLTLAIGIGGNTAIFSVVSALLLNPLPYPDSERIVIVNEAPPGGLNGSCGGTFLEWYDHNEHFEKLAALHPINKNLTGRGDPIQVQGWEVTAEYLEVYGIQPAMGRGFTSADDAPGGNHSVAVITHEFWQSRFSGRPGILGELIQLDGTGYEVIGVLAPEALMSPDVQFLSPAGILSQEYKQDRNYSYVTTTTGRLKPGATAEQATAQLTAVKQQFNHLYPAYKQEWTTSVGSLQEAMFGGSRQSLMLLLGSVGVVLLIACANVANLLLAKTTARQGELALRLALGASTGRLVRQLLTESLLLAFLGGLAGIWLGAMLIEPLAQFAEVDQLQGLEIGLQSDVLGFALGATLLTGLVFGIFPALRASQPNVNEQLKDGVRGATVGKRKGLQSALIISETALTVVLLVAAGLFLRSLINVAGEETGFIREGTLTFQVTQSGDTAQTIEKRTQFTDGILHELRQIPSVTGAAMISSLPMNNQGGSLGDTIHRVDRPETAGNFGAGFDGISPDYFNTLGIPLLRGRTLTANDNREDAPKVMIVSQELVNQMYDEGEDALGSQLFFKGEPWEIVGIVGSIRRFSFDSPMISQVYFAQAHFPWYTHYIVRTSLPPLSLASQVRAAVQTVNPDQPIAHLNTLEAIAKDTMSGRTVMLTLLAMFAGVALLLACIGIYGVMAYTVNQRTREMGIRVALGATARDVIHLVLNDGLKLIFIGLFIGAIGAGFATQIFTSQLYNVGRLDPTVFIGVSLTLVAAGSLACFVPAKRATHVDPAVALRAE